MKLTLRAVSSAALMVLVAACSGTKPYDYAAYREADPHSILVIPVTNKSTQVDAPDNFLATLAMPLAERGYYVFPTNMVKRTMEDDGLSDADMVRSADTVRLAGLFGADAVLYGEIEEWKSSYLVIQTTTTVKVHYTLKSGKTGATLWDKTISSDYTRGGVSINPVLLAVNAVVAGIERAHPSYVPVANQANMVAFNTPDQGVLSGPYDSGYKKR